jgi:hypothetical protein
MRPRPRAFLLLIGLSLSIGGCGGSNKTPAATANTFAGHVEARRYGEAYDLLSEDARKVLSRQDFEKLLKEHPELSDELVTALKSDGKEPVVTAVLTTKSGRVLRMVLENGEFRFDESAIDLYPRRTPQETVESFVRALRQKRYEVLMDFIPRELQEGLDPGVLKNNFESVQKSEIAHLTAALEGSISALNVEILGERALVRYGTQSRVDLILEDGLWKIEDFK